MMHESKGQHIGKAGKWKTLKCENRSMETEVWKPKFGSEIIDSRVTLKSRVSVFSVLLTQECVC